MKRKMTISRGPPQNTIHQYPCLLNYNHNCMDGFSLLRTLKKNRFIPVSSSSSYRAGSTDIPDPLSPLLPIVHRPR